MPVVQSEIRDPKSEMREGEWRMEQVLILVTAIGSMFVLIGLVIGLAYFAAKRDIEGSA